MKYFIEMTVEEWIEVPDNPRQRDTIRRAKRARRKHLSEYNEMHCRVIAAMMDGELFCKIDGHTRAYLWEHGMLDRPPNGKVIAQLFSVSSIDEAKRLYTQTDSVEAVKQVRDVLEGFANEIGLELTSRPFQIIDLRPP